MLPYRHEGVTTTHRTPHLNATALAVAKHSVRAMQHSGLHPTHITYNSLIYAAARSFRRAEHAHTLFSQMMVDGHAPDVYSFNAVLLKEPALRFGVCRTARGGGRQLGGGGAAAPASGRSFSWCRHNSGKFAVHRQPRGR